MPPVRGLCMVKLRSSCVAGGAAKASFPGTRYPRRRPPLDHATRPVWPFNSGRDDVDPSVAVQTRTMRAATGQFKASPCPLACRRPLRHIRAVKIVITSPIFPPDLGGPSTYVPHLASYLVDRGHDVTVVAFCSDPEPKGWPFKESGLTGAFTT